MKLTKQHKLNRLKTQIANNYFNLITTQYANQGLKNRYIKYIARSLITYINIQENKKNISNIPPTRAEIKITDYKQIIKLFYDCVSDERIKNEVKKTI